MSWRSNRTAVVALGITLAVMLGLAVMPRVRGSMLRVTRAGAHRLDSSTEATSHDAVEATVDRPQTPLVLAPAADPQLDPTPPAAGVLPHSFEAPTLTAISTVAPPASVTTPGPSRRLSEARAPPAL